MSRQHNTAQADIARYGIPPYYNVLIILVGTWFDIDRIGLFGNIRRNAEFCRYGPVLGSEDIDINNTRGNPVADIRKCIITQRVSRVRHNIRIDQQEHHNKKGHEDACNHDIFYQVCNTGLRLPIRVRSRSHCKRSLRCYNVSRYWYREHCTNLYNSQQHPYAQEKLSGCPAGYRAY